MSKKFSQLPGDLRIMSHKLISKIAAILPEVIKVEGLKHFEASWDNQGFTDTALVKWGRRKPPSHKNNKDGSTSKSYKRWQHKNDGRAILVGHQTDKQGTHLKDTLRATNTSKQVTFTTNKEYAQVHNEGGQAGRGDGFTMEQRQFMGPSETLNKAIAVKMDKEITKFLKSL